MRLTPLLLTLALVLIGPPAGLTAQDRASPTAVVRGFFEAYFDGSWEVAAGFFHPDFRAHFQTQYVRELMRPIRGDSAQVEATTAWWPVRDSSAAVDMTDTELLGRVLEANDFRISLRRVFDQRLAESAPNIDASDRPAFEEAIDMRPILVGEVIEGETAWVLYRAPHSPPAPPSGVREPPELIQLKRQGAHWGIADANATRDALGTYFFPILR